MKTDDVNVERSVREYRDRFYKIISLNKRDLDVIELKDWCRDNLGRQYLDWTIIDRGRQQPNLELWIREEERYLIYRLRWGNDHETYNLGTVHKL